MTLWLDSCVASIIIGEKGPYDEKIKERFDEKKLRNYIRHHGFYISNFCIFEIIRRGNISLEELENRINDCNGKVIGPEYNNINRNKLKENIKLIIKEVRKELFDFASGYYSLLITFPLYLIQEFIILPNISNVNKEEVIKESKSFVKQIRQTLKKKINESFYSGEKNFKKQEISNIINKYFLLEQQQICNYSNDIPSIKPNKLSFEVFCELNNKYISLQETIDIQSEIINKANEKTNYVFSLYEILTKMNIEHDKETIEKKTKVFIDRYIHHFLVQQKAVIKVFLRNEISRIYLSWSENNEALIKWDKLFDSNNIVDLLNYYHSREKQENILITTDNTINSIISELENEEYKKRCSDFVKYDFTSDNLSNL